MAETLCIERYEEQVKRWPQRVQQIMAQFDASTVVIYQAYGPSISAFTVHHQRFGGDFSFERMSWIKANFLWMMFRSGWGTKPEQEVTLAIWLKRAPFDDMRRQSVHSHFAPTLYPDEAHWQATVPQSSVRLQWDPDHDLMDGRIERRALQLGLRGDVLRACSDAWIVHIEDVSAFVAAQRENVVERRFERIETPFEAVYPVNEAALAAKLGLER